MKPSLVVLHTKLDSTVQNFIITLTKNVTAGPENAAADL